MHRVIPLVPFSILSDFPNSIGSPDQLKIQLSCCALSVQYGAGNINLIEGGVWSEKVAGTNAIGTALAAAEPVQL